MTERFFYGWVVLAAAFVIITMSIGTLFTLGVFLKPIEESMGWSRSGIGAIGLFNWIVMGVGGVVSGFVSDRLGTRRVVLVGAALLGLGLVLSSHVQQVWQFYVTFGLLVGAGVSAFYVPLTVLAIKWFEGRRGMAAAVVSTGNGLGILALAPLTRWLINEFDWRVAFLVLGNLAWVVVVPCALLLRQPAGGHPAGGQPFGGQAFISSGSSAAGAQIWPPHSPGGGQAFTSSGSSAAGAQEWPPRSPGGGQAFTSSGSSAAGAQIWPPHSPSGGQPSRGLAVGVAAAVSARSPWATWPFWAIALTHFFCCAAHSGPLFHLVSHAMDRGVTEMAAAGILGASGLTSMFGRVGAGIVADRVGPKRTLLAALSLQAVLVLLYLFATSTGALYTVSLAFGVAYGGAMPLYALVTREYFGERVLGTAYGAVFFISCIGMGLGSYAGGAIHDLLGTYQWLFLGSFAIGVMAVVLGMTLRPPVAVSLPGPSPALGA
ncbi:MAG: MFS transporter [Candidatus Rokuibacteriota bacterium]